MSFRNQEIRKIQLCADKIAPFEQFCQRNGIPFSRFDGANGEMIYLVRNGLDYIDAMIFVLKALTDRRDADLLNKINHLILMRYYYVPVYDYELSIPKRADEILLSLHV